MELLVAHLIDLLTLVALGGGVWSLRALHAHNGTVEGKIDAMRRELPCAEQSERLAIIETRLEESQL